MSEVTKSSAGIQCFGCVYHGVCEDSRINLMTDCHIPEAPLRKRQNEAYKQGGIDMFAAVTHTYIFNVKLKSKYWTKLKLEAVV